MSSQNSTRDQLDQDLDCLRQCTYVEEADEISQLVQATVATDGLGAETAYPRFRKIVSAANSFHSMHQHSVCLTPV